VLSNTGTDRGLPISCFGIDVADSIQDIGSKNLEMMLLAKHGGGVGIGINQIRPAGAKITGNGTSDGVVPFCKIYDSTILATNQGSVRRGAASVNINIDHPDFDEWLEIREPKGDVNRQSLNMHQCAVVGDKFMRRIEQGDRDARKRWGKLLQKRKATGEPYILFKGNTNKNNPKAYKDNGFLMALWRNLFKEQKDLEVLKMPFVLLRKDARLGWVYWDGTRISKKRVFLLKVCLLSLKLGKYFRKLKSSLSVLVWILLKFMANLCGVLVVVIVILTLGLLLPLLAIQSLAETFHPE
jgi:hypothetical protein